MKKLLGIVVLGLLKYHPIYYGTTVTKLLPREIKAYFSRNIIATIFSGLISYWIIIFLL